VRNPSYTGLYGFIGSGTIIMITSELAERIVGLRTTLIQTGWLGTAILIISGITAIRIAHRNVIAPRIKNEETMLEGKFGSEWEEYTKNVPYRILPYVW
jgi:protein-S-isoprenylcysteine O-methyltransferase Ste14